MNIYSTGRMWYMLFFKLKMFIILMYVLASLPFITVLHYHRKYFQVGDDKTVKQWKMDGPGCGEEEEPLHTILGKVQK